MAKHPKNDASKNGKNGKKNARADRAATQAVQLSKLQDDARKVKVESAPVIRALSSAPVVLPEVVAPSLENFVVVMDDAMEITADALTSRLHEEVRAISPQRLRDAGERPALGDEVVLNMLGYAGGAILPFSVKMGFRTELRSFPHMPGLAEGITEIPVGEGRAIAVTFSDDYPVETLRGANAKILVDVLVATEVDTLDPTDDATLAKLGRGKTLDDVMASLAETLDGDAGEALLIEAQSRALDELANKVNAAVPSSAVDEEILREWGRLEGGALARLDFSSEEQEEALNAWLRDNNVRAEAARRIRISLALNAIAERDGVEVEKKDVMAMVKSAAEVAGVRAADAMRALKDDTAEAAKIVRAARHLKVVAHVMAKAKFRFPDELN